MRQSKRFWNRLSSLFSVAAFGKGSAGFGKKLAASILLGMAVGGIPTVGQAVNVKFYVTTFGPICSTQPALCAERLVYQTADQPTRTLGESVPCTTTSTGQTICRKVTEVPIVPASPGTLCTPHPAAPQMPTGCLFKDPLDPSQSILKISLDAKGQATVETNAATIASSATITNTLNVSGTIQYVGNFPEATLRIETSSDFTLRSDLGGTWRAANKGASKCVKQSDGTYKNQLCTFTTGSIDNGNCTLCRSYGFTDEGYVLKKNSAGAYTLPGTGVVVNMTSDVIFTDTGGVQTTRQLRSLLNKSIPEVSTIIEDGHFYIAPATDPAATPNESIPCEPFRQTCTSSEKRTTKLVFQKMKPDYQVSLPVTSTDVSAVDPGSLLAQLKFHVPIDVQPIETQEPRINNDWIWSEGTVHVAAFSTPDLDVCTKVQSFDQRQGLVKLSVAGSDFVELSGVTPIEVNGNCVGLDFRFDRSQINATIAGTTTAEKLQTCNENPTATLLMERAELETAYTVSPQRGGKPGGTYETSEECSLLGDTVTCRITGIAGGSQVVKCAVPAGG